MAILIEIKKEKIELPKHQMEYFVAQTTSPENLSNINEAPALVSAVKKRYVLKDLQNEKGERMQFLVEENDLGIFNGLLDLTNIEIEKYGNKKGLFSKMETIEAIIGLLNGRGFFAGPCQSFFDKQGRNIKRLLYKNDILKLKTWLEEVEKEFYKI